MKNLFSFSLVALMALTISCGRKSPSVSESNENVAQQEVVDSTAVASANSEGQECEGNCEGCDHNAEQKTEGNTAE